MLFEIFWPTALTNSVPISGALKKFSSSRTGFGNQAAQSSCSPLAASTDGQDRVLPRPSIRAASGAVTGGLAPLFAASSPDLALVDPDLTLRGLKILHDRNADARPPRRA